MSLQGRIQDISTPSCIFLCLAKTVDTPEGEETQMTGCKNTANETQNVECQKWYFQSL